MRFRIQRLRFSGSGLQDYDSSMDCDFSGFAHFSGASSIPCSSAA